MSIQLVETEKKEIKEQIITTKIQLKELVEIQKKEKAILRTPHHKLPFIKIISCYSGMLIGYKGVELASNLMYLTLNRAGKITQLHRKYNSLRGKPTNMHEYK
jgi:hypothetical protein